MDIEWGKDGQDGQLYILQARPETVKSRQSGTARCSGTGIRERGAVIVGGPRHRAEDRGRRVRGAAPRSPICISSNPGEVLVADMTDPDWEPIMNEPQRSSPIVADGPAMRRSSLGSSESLLSSAPALRPGSLQDGQAVTVSCAEGDTGYVYAGLLDFDVEESEQRQHAKHRCQDHDERGHPGPGVRVLPVT